MKYRVTFDVVSDYSMQGPEAIEWQKWRINLTRNEKGVPESLSIECGVEEYESLLPRLTGAKPGVHDLSIPDNPLEQELRGIVEYLESIGSFWFGFRRFDWHSARHDWVPESEAERRMVPVLSFSVSSEYPTGSPAPIPSSELADLLDMREDLEYLTIPMAFFREGKVEFSAKRYIQAFFHFYFFLEGLYGGGKTKNVAVQQCFLKSHTVMASVAEALPLLDEVRHKSRLHEMFANAKCAHTQEGVVKFLVAMRGNLHHFSIRSSKEKGHPLNQSKFESLAFLAMSIVTILLAKIITTGKLEPEPGT